MCEAVLEIEGDGRRGKERGGGGVRNRGMCEAGLGQLCWEEAPSQ